LFVTEADVDVWVGVIDGGVGDEGRREWRLEAQGQGIMRPSGL